MLLALLAGILSILSPCVLPLVPVVLTGAVAEHRIAPLALAAGVALSFTAIGLFVATIGFSIGLDMTAFRTGAAVLLTIVGAVLLVPRLQVGFATAAGPLSNWTQSRFSGLSTSGISGQFGVGLLLGAVWTPCVGPVLGGVLGLAATRSTLGSGVALLVAYSLGLGVPFLATGLAFGRLTSLFARVRRRLFLVNAVSGVALVAFGILLLTDNLHWLSSVSADVLRGLGLNRLTVS